MSEQFQHIRERWELLCTKTDEIRQKLEKYKAYKTYSKPARGKT